MRRGFRGGRLDRRPDLGVVSFGMIICPMKKE